MSSSITSLFLITSRLDSLSAFLHTIEQHKGRMDAFNALDPQDRTRILGVLKISKFDWIRIEKKGLKGRIQIELQSMTKELRSLATKLGFFQQLPNKLITTTIGPYLTGTDLAAFHESFKAASKLQISSHTIKYYHLEPLIETYLHSASSGITESGKAKMLDKLMSFAYHLSRTEYLPRPSYPSLVFFFKLIEARNLIRMIRGLNKVVPLPDLDKTVNSLGIPKNPKWAIKRAMLIRCYLAKHSDFLAGLTGNFDLSLSNLTLLPKEIGKLRGLQSLDLEMNYLVTIPKEIGLLTQLQGFDLKDNNLTSLPKEISQLNALNDLGLENNYLAHLLKEIGQLRDLKGLYLEDNYLTFLPRELAQIPALQFLCLSGNGLVELPENLGRFNNELNKQNKKLQLKTLLDRLMLCLKNGHNCKGISALLTKIEVLLGKKIRSALERSLYEVCKKAAKTNPKLRTKLKNPLFGKKAFSDQQVHSKFKAIAIAQFWKSNNK